MNDLRMVKAKWRVTELRPEKHGTGKSWTLADGNSTTLFGNCITGGRLCSWIDPQRTQSSVGQITRDGHRFRYNDGQRWPSGHWLWLNDGR